MRQEWEAHLAPDPADGAGAALDLHLGLVGQVCHCCRHHALLGGLELDLPGEDLGDDGVDRGLGIGKPEHVGCHDGEVDGAQVAEGVAVVQQQVAGRRVDGEGQGEPPVELQGEVACPHTNHRDDLYNADTWVIAVPTSSQGCSIVLAA